MGKPPDRSSATTDYLRRLGNPYATLQIDDDVYEDAEAVVRAHARLLENPYAKHQLEAVKAGAPADNTAKSSPALLSRARSGGVSKASFQQRCRTIFRQYVPPLEGGSLRPAHRDFIVRNENRSPIARDRILTQLQRYDLSSVGGISPQFNRERNELTEGKLRLIESAVEDDLDESSAID